MHTFANKFSIALNNDSTEVMITFYQNYPPLEDQPVPANNCRNIVPESEPVSKLVMTVPFAKAFSEKLLALIDANSQEN